MASLIRRGKKWYVAWREDGEQRRKSLDTTSKADAKKLLEVWHREQARDRIKGKQKNPTVAEFHVVYDPWARSHLKQKTRDVARQQWRDFIVWAAKDQGVAGESFEAVSKHIRLGDITKPMLERFKVYLLDTPPGTKGRHKAGSTGRSKVTTNNYMRSISAHLGRAIKLDVFSGPNPCAGVERLREEQTPPPYLANDQIVALMAAAEAHGNAMHWFCMLGVYQGLRLGEIVNAQWQWFDWPGKMLHIPSDETFSLKSHKGRTIPLNDKVVEAMHPHAKESGYLFEAGESRGATTGTWLYRWNPRRSFMAVLRHAKLDSKAITPHVLRHTFGTQLARAGVSIYKIREWMGHSDVKVTARYAHVQGYDGDINRL